MKKQIVMLACIAAVLMMAGCGRDVQNKTENQQPQKNSQETGEASEGSVSGKIEQEAETPADETDSAEGKEDGEESGIAAAATATVTPVRLLKWKDEKNVTIMTGSVNNISVKIAGNKAAETAVNTFFAEKQASYEDTAEEYLAMAKTAMAAGEHNAEADWMAYGLGREYKVKRADERMLSITEDFFVDEGDGNFQVVRTAYNFDMQTGKRLMLSDVASDLDEMRIKCVQYIGEKLQKPEEMGIHLNSGYTAHLEDILTDATWYTAQDGLFIICNPELITPPSEGIREFKIPYDEVNVLDKYLPKGGQPE